MRLRDSRENITLHDRSSYTITWFLFAKTGAFVVVSMPGHHRQLPIFWIFLLAGPRAPYRKTLLLISPRAFYPSPLPFSARQSRFLIRFLPPCSTTRIPRRLSFLSFVFAVFFLNRAIQATFTSSVVLNVSTRSNSGENWKKKIVKYYSTACKRVPRVCPGRFASEFHWKIRSAVTTPRSGPKVSCHSWRHNNNLRSLPRTRSPLLHYIERA